MPRNPRLDVSRLLQQAGALYDRRGFKHRVGFGRRPAVIVVDLMRGFTDPACPLGSDLDGVVRATRRILAIARQRRVPILFTAIEYAEGLADAGLWPRKIPALTTLAQGSPWTELDARLKRRPTEPVVWKKYASAFFGTDLASRLICLRIDTLVLVGATTSGCIRATAIDGIQYGYRVVIPREGVGDRAHLPHEVNLFDIDGKYGDVTSLGAVLRHLRRPPIRSA
jgi:maleamate amidohydrolase